MQDSLSLPSVDKQEVCNVKVVTMAKAPRRPCTLLHIIACGIAVFCLFYGR